MAIFNIEPNPTNSNFLDKSRGTDRASPKVIRQVPPVQRVDFGRGASADTSSADLINSLTKTGASAIKAIDDILVDTIEEQVRTGVEHYRDSFTSDLEGSVGVTGPSNVLAYAKDDSITKPIIEDNPDSRLPKEIREIDKKVSKLDSARAAAKLTESGYWIQLETYLSGLRNRFPGHRDVIDRKAASMLGTTPANALWRTYLSALTSRAIEARNQSGAVNNIDVNDKYIEKNAKFLSVNTQKLRYSDTPPSNAVLRREIDINKSREFELDQLSSSIAVDESKNKVNTRKIKQLAIQRINKIGRDVAQTFLESDAGKELKTLLDKEIPSPEEKRKAIELFREFNTNLNNHLNDVIDQKMFSQTDEEGNKTFYGPTLRSRLGEEDTKEVLKSGMFFLEHMEEQMFQDNWGTFNQMTATLKALEDQRVYDIYKQEPRILDLHVINKKLGPTGLQIAYTAMDNAEKENGNKTGLNEVARFMRALMSGKRSNGDFNSLRDQNRYLRDRGFNTTDNPEIFRGPVDDPIQIILNPSVQPQAKLDQAKTLFNDESTSEISRMSEDNQKRVYDKVTSKAFMNSMKDLRTFDEVTWSNYKQFVTDRFAAIHRPAIGLINSNDETYVSIVFDTKSAQFLLTQTDEQRQTESKDLSRQGIPPVQRAVGGGAVSQNFRSTKELINAVAEVNRDLTQLSSILKENNQALFEFEINRLLSLLGLSANKTASNERKE